MTAPQKGRIFISYRRADSAGYAGRIYDRLVAHFGKDAVFMDVDTIEAGLDFVEVLENAVQSCDVLIALIGTRWLNIKDSEGKRRLDNPEDFVRIEIAAALRRRIRVIPVLLAGANMPNSKELPHGLKSLARRNAVFVDHHSFNADAHRLVSQLERALKAAEESKIIKAQELQAERERRERQAKIEKLLTQADTALALKDWQLAKEKLQKILALEAEHIQAQAKLEFVEEKLVEIKAEEERIAQEEARKRAEKREQARKEEEKRKEVALEKARQERRAREKKIAGEKARQEALKKARQQERAEKTKKLFSSMGKLPIYIIAGIALFLLFSYLIKNIPAPVVPKPTQDPATEIPATPTLILPTSTFIPTLIELPTETPFTPTPTLGIGSTMISEKDGMTLLYVPAGEFEMGNDADDALAECQKFRTDCERDWFTDEEPVHTVYLDSYWIDQTEITNEMYAKCVSTGDCNPPRKTGSYTRDNYYGNSAFDDYPVIYVSWEDANNYCTWAERRLPTEAEWEKAARGGLEGKKYPWGDSAPICEYGAENGAKFDDNAGCNDTDTEKVASYAPNGYGIYDMAGNVWEWVSSLYKDYPYDALDGREDLSIAGRRVLRGGSWYYYGYLLRSAVRDGSIPASSNDYGGFRCSRSP